MPKLAGVALVTALVGLGWAAMRVHQLEGWERIQQVTFHPRQVEEQSLETRAEGPGPAVSGPPGGPPGAGDIERRAQLTIASLEWPEELEMEVAVNLCGISLPARQDLNDRLTLRLIASPREIPAQPAEPFPATSVRWSQEPRADHFLLVLPTGCLAFVHRATNMAGDLQLTWEEGAWSGLEDQDLDLSIITRPVLRAGDWVILGLLLLAALLLLTAGQRTSRSEASVDIGSALIPLSLFFLFPMLWPVDPTSATSIFVSTAVTDIAYVGAIWVIALRVPSSRVLAVLSFHRLAVKGWGVATALGLLLAVAAYLAMPFYSSGESEMTEMVKVSSGVMSLATLGLVSVWAEELLLRGVLYGACEHRWGGAVAILVSAGVFSLLHLAQHWGNLFAWAMVSVTGLGLSLVRFSTGSTLASTVSHLVYNLLLIAPSMVLAG